MPAILDQLIGGHALSWTSVEFIAGPKHLSLMTALSYQHGVEQGELRGTGPYVYSTTRGNYRASGSMTLYVEEAALLRAALIGLPGGGGYLEKRFTAIVTLTEPLAGKTVVDTIEGMRLTQERAGWSQGGDPLMLEYDFFARRILRGGVPAVFDHIGKPV